MNNNYQILFHFRHIGVKKLFFLLFAISYFSTSSYAQNLSISGTCLTSTQDNVSSGDTYPVQIGDSDCTGTYTNTSGTEINSKCVKYELNGPAGAVITYSAGLGVSCKGNNANIFDSDMSIISEGPVDGQMATLPTVVWICGSKDNVSGQTNICITGLTAPPCTAANCDDGDPCTIDECDANGNCTFTPIDCDDGDPCTIDECVNGVCINTPIVCDDGDPCTVDECVNGVCTFTDITAVCPPINPDPCKTYTLIDCECVSTDVTPTCPPANADPCKVYELDENCNCVSEPSPIIGQPCNDANACTINDKYDEDCNCRGELIGYPGDTCDDGDECTINDTLNEDCQCKGEPGPDSDKDGMLDCMDPCPFDIDGMVHANLRCSELVSSNNSIGKSALTDYGACSEDCLSPGREIVYRFTQTSQSDIVITFKEAGHPQLRRLNLFVLTNPCTPKGCMPENAINAPLMGNQDPERVVIKDATPGVYYIIVDGHKPYATNDFTLLLECTGGSVASCPDDAHYFESFESYNVGKGITTQDPDHWETVGNSSGSATISQDRASNYEQSIEFNRFDGGVQDINLDLGEKQSGTHRISWDMYIHPMSTAHFGLFGGDNSDPWGTVGYTFRMHETKYQGKWFKVELFVDMDKNKYALFIDNRHYQDRGIYYLNLHHLNFYSPPGGHFYVDNICYAAIEAMPSVSSTTETSTDRRQDSRFTEDITLFPNPARDEVMLDLRKYTGKEVDLVIYNAMSFEVYRKHIPKVGKELERVSLDNFTNGLYLVNVKGKGMRAKTKKLIVSKLY